MDSQDKESQPTESHSKADPLPAVVFPPHLPVLTPTSAAATAAAVAASDDGEDDDEDDPEGDGENVTAEVLGQLGTELRYGPIRRQEVENRD